MIIRHGSRRLVVGAHYGLRDWLVQRASAVVLAIYALILLALLLQPGDIDQARWVAIVSTPWMKVTSLVAFVALARHAWLGMREIWMDYVKPLSVRLALMVLTLAWAVGCVAWAVNVLWRL